MSKSSQPKSTNGSTRTADRTPPSASDDSGPVFSRIVRKRNLKETAQEAVHQVMPREDVEAPAKTEDGANPPLRAAKGDDDLMSQPVKRT